ncbi:hypothetical protein [Clostridium sp.]|uniref:hypothetical protein n=1 Tax=Clostridium sp. TaxID=1506 RepID=UPI003D6D503D
MKKEMLDLDYLRTKKEIFYWVHFILFVMTKLNIFVSNYVRVPILFMYLVGVFFILIKNSEFIKSKIKNSKVKLMLAFGLYMILNAVIIKVLNVYVIYWVVTFIFIKELKFSSDEILSLINKTAIVYFILSILLNYTPLKSLSWYEVRQIRSRFLPFAYRFIGVSSTPAGPDIFYLIVLISNLILNKGKSKYFYMILGALVVIWTASLSPFMSLAGAIIILPFTKNKVLKIIYGSMLWLYQFIIMVAYALGSEGIRHILNRLSTTRSMIWYHLYLNFMEKSSISQFIFGRKELVEFWHFLKLINNPHNFSLIVIQFAGIIGYSIIIIFATYNFQKLQDKYTIFMISLLMIYSSTNTYIFTIRGNPIFIYILIAYLFSRNESKKIKEAVHV